MNLILFFLPLTVSAWSIAFYTGENCEQDTSFNDVQYLGDTQSDCLIPGERGQDDVDHCTWYTNNGADSAVCTGPMDPQPQSWMFGSNGQPTPMCYVNYEEECDILEWEHVPVQGECYKIADLEAKPNGNPIHFRCFDGHNS
ncbi:Hypothetical predicted protein [Lecanosticta acicola]|uniref:Secreted LysM effector LysM C-terminal domain-containing protein n=1 Tax=Lecanosticta acicola TaxID=111012 RepID=A0AAI8YTZ4_9PEZI|nr:Hypothetical predicted protein [Lecanosticta acicola]